MDGTLEITMRDIQNERDYRNIPIDKVGIKNVIDFSRQVGISSPLASDLSLGLGSSSVGLILTFRATRPVD